MRKSRLRTYNSTYRVIGITAKVLMIWYLVIFSVSYLTTNTEALFTDEIDSKGKIESGFWRTDYKLAFMDKGNSNLKKCTYPVEIKATIKNIGKENMNETASYEVYYVENGNPKKGMKVSEGTIEILEKNEKTELKYEVQNQPGRYAFVAKYETEDKQHEVWSKETKVDCTVKKEKTIESKNDKKIDSEQSQDNREQNVEIKNDGIIEKQDGNSGNALERKDKPQLEPKNEMEVIETGEQTKEVENRSEPIIEQPSKNQEEIQEIDGEGEKQE